MNTDAVPGHVASQSMMPPYVALIVYVTSNPYLSPASVESSVPLVIIRALAESNLTYSLSDAIDPSARQTHPGESVV